jgi:hypothetical protein
VNTLKRRSLENIIQLLAEKINMSFDELVGKYKSEVVAGLPTDNT